MPSRRSARARTSTAKRRAPLAPRRLQRRVAAAERMRAAATRLWSRLGASGALLFAVLVLALALRLDGIGWGLPYSFVNVDESTVVPKAFAAARGHLNPQFFY